MKELLIAIAPLCVLLAAGGCRAATPRPAIVAHRGASEDAPENTLASFRLGFEQGADLVEGDFRMTRDGRIVAMHDATLSRTTGDPRDVAAITHAELRALSAGDWGRWEQGGFRGEGVPTLAEALAIIPRGRGMLLELKGSERIVPTLVRELDRSGLGTDRITVIAFDREVVRALKSLAPKWKALWLTSFSRETGAWRPSIEEVIETAVSIGADGVDVKAEPAILDRPFVERVKAAGLEVHCWTVNDVEIARRLSAAGVDSITTDRPAVILEAIGR